jgi:hypothetical protein
VSPAAQRKAIFILKESVKLFNSGEIADEFSIHSLRSDAEKLLAEDLGESTEALGFLAALTGDLNGIKKWFNIATRSSNRQETRSNFLICLQYIGEITEAADQAEQWFKESANSPETLIAMATLFAISGRRKIYHQALKRMCQMDIQVGDEESQQLPDKVDGLFDGLGIDERSLAATIQKYMQALVNQGCRIKSTGWADISEDSGYDVGYVVRCIGDDRSIMNADIAGVNALVEDRDIPSAVINHVLFYMESA